MSKQTILVLTRLSFCILLVLFGLAPGCHTSNDSGSADSGYADAESQVDPSAACVERQKSILERSGWALNGGLGEIVDSLLQKRATAEDLPICTEIRQ